MAISRNKILPVLAVVILIGAAAAVWLRSRDHSTDGEIRVSGNIEVTQAQVSFKTPGRVSERLVSEGERVTAGQVVARLDATDLEQEVQVQAAELRNAKAALQALYHGSRPEEIAQAAAETEQTKARLDELVAGPRSQEIATAEAAVEAARKEAEQARFAMEFARSENARQTELFARGVVSARDKENAQTAFDTAEAALQAANARLGQAQAQLDLLRAGTREEQLAQARASLTQARQHYNLVKKGPRAEDIEQGQARVQSAEESLALARTRLGYAQAVSPLTGLCLTHDVEPGEYVNPGTPVVTVADLVNVWLRGYVDETDLGRVKAGQKATVTVDSYPGKAYEGVVTFIASEAEFTPRNVQTEKERVKLVYRVKVTIQNPNMELKPGMPADGVIHTTEP
jgi:HlyD family secretion protein